MKKSDFKSMFEDAMASIVAIEEVIGSLLGLKFSSPALEAKEKDKLDELILIAQSELRMQKRRYDELEDLKYMLDIEYDASLLDSDYVNEQVDALKGDFIERRPEFKLVLH